LITSNPSTVIDWSKQPVEFWSNSTYSVCAYRNPNDEIGLIAIRRHDWKPCSDWRDKQAIKSQIVGPDWEAAELYPAEARVQDEGNWSHLWVMPKGERYPWGYIESAVSRSDKPARANEVQRPLVQRGDISPLKREPHVFIAMPCYGNMPCETVEALLRANKELPFPHTIRFHKGNSLVPSARNQLAADFMAGPWTHLLFIDSDIVFTPAQIVRLFSHNEPIIGGLYAQKLFKTRLCVDEEIKHDSSRHLMEVCHLGAGFLSIRRDVFETMIAALGPEIEYISTDTRTGRSRQQWDFFSIGIRWCEDGKPRYLSEDFYFCERARELGFKVYVDLRVMLGHIGQVTFPVWDKWSKASNRETQECERLAGEIHWRNRGSQDKEAIDQ
jgi:hypothetical protein